MTLVPAGEHPAPGVIETDFTKEVLSRPGTRAYLANNNALGRSGAPEDIGGAADLLCSDSGRWTNSPRVEASGGMFL